MPSIPGYDQVLDILLKGRDQMVQGGQPVGSVLPGDQRRNEHRIGASANPRRRVSMEGNAATGAAEDAQPRRRPRS